MDISNKITGAITSSLNAVNEKASQVAEGSTDMAIDKLTDAAKALSQRLREKGMEDCNIGVSTSVLGFQIEINGPVRMFLGPLPGDE